jgi:predicted amidohydrolase YtcJ
MRNVHIPALFGLLAACSSCNPPSRNPTLQADELYFGGDIVTMEGDSATYADALATKDGKIIFVGDRQEADRLVGDSTTLHDLNGKTLLPGFIDGHAHFYAFGVQGISANLLASPDGACNSIEDIISEMKQWHEKNGTNKTQGWILGIGFDDAALKEKRFPTKTDLDKVSTEVPVMAIHISGHFCTVNSKGLQQLGITAASESPSGGVIRRIPGRREPNGVLEELAAIPHMMRVISPATPDISDLYMEEGQRLAARYGYTTVNEGRAMRNHEAIADYAIRGKLYLDVNAWIDYSQMHYLKTEWHSKEYKSHYRIAGMKLTLDGSPQGRTAWRTTPYLIPPDGQRAGYRGYPVIPNDADVQQVVDSAFANGWQLKIHVNGDAAADQLFMALGKAEAKYGRQDRRNILIHGQLIRHDQLDSMLKYQLIGSFFPMHTFYWGDWYKEIIGPEKAQQISPIKSALKKGVRVTSHTDAPVALPNLMMILWTTVNRVSRTGTVMGPEERLTPYEALQCITAWGALQFAEEHNKGTLSVGKLADLVVLDRNPLKVDPIVLKDIKVVETIKEGKTVFKQDD